MLLQLDLPKVFNDSLTTNPEEALIHIVPLWEISFEKLSALQKYQPNIVAIKVYSFLLPIIIIYIMIQILMHLL